MNDSTGKVWLVGAGPGDPGLLTVRGAELVSGADVIFLDALASPDTIRNARADALIFDAGKRAGHHRMTQDEINAALVEHAREGRMVVRLKGGDPFVFGRGGEEGAYLREHGIDFEVVPGVTSAIAGPAYAGIPVTFRGLSTSCSFITGHESDESEEIDWQALAASASTLVFLMGLGRLESICTNLRSAGLSEKTPVAVISRATTPRQRTVTGDLETIVDRVDEARLPTPALIVVGRVVELREPLRWFDMKPLFGKRIAVTRARAQASGLVTLLGRAGAAVLESPTIEVVPPDSWESVDAAIDRLDKRKWLVFTSVNSVEFFFERLHATGRDSRALHGNAIGAVGTKTAEALSLRGIRADLVPARATSADLAASILERDAQPTILMFRASEGSDDLLDAVGKAGGTAELVVTYRTVPATASVDLLRTAVDQHDLDAVTFTSASTVANFVDALGDDRKSSFFADGPAIFSIGPRTTAAIREAGGEAIVEADEASIESLADAVIAYYDAR